MKKPNLADYVAVFCQTYGILKPLPDFEGIRYLETNLKEDAQRYFQYSCRHIKDKIRHKIQVLVSGMTGYWTSVIFQGSGDILEIIFVYEGFRVTLYYSCKDNEMESWFGIHIP